MKSKNLQIKRALRSVLLVLMLNVVGLGKMYAYDFSVVCETGQTLYYSITDATNHYVALTCPGTANYYYSWSGYTQPTGDIILPESVQYNGTTYSVTSIGNYAFNGCSGLTGSLTIPNSVITIGEMSFYNCTGFSGSLTIPNFVTTIGHDAFSGCSGFSGNLSIGNSVATIDYGAFYNCNGFTGSLTIPNSVTSIGNYAFRNCSGFTGDLVIPSSVTTIGDYAFYSCDGFTGNLTIPNSVTTIGYGVFYNCSSLTGSLAIPNSVTTIGGEAFYNCSGFTGDLTIPNSVTTIGSYAFGGCSGFTGSLTIGNSVTMIGYYAFKNCSFTEVYYNAINCGDASLGYGPFSYCSGTLTIGDDVERIPAYMFYGCDSFTGSLVIPNSVTTIGDFAFSVCTGFTGDLTIGSSVTAIGFRAFSGCRGFTGSLTIGNSVISIDSYAFSDCSGFNSITSFAETPPILSTGAFEYWGSNTFVYVPCGFEEDYVSLSWGGFNSFYGMCGGMVTVASDPYGSGVVTGGGSFGTGETCTVIATANEGYTFINWTKNGMIVTFQTEYTFYVAGDMTLLAHFVPEGNIVFADDNVKNICVSHWDTNGDGELSYVEAALVTSLDNYFKSNSQIISFDELQYFIGLSSIMYPAFYGCSGLTSIVLPNSVRSIGSGAFQDCNSLTLMEIPEFVTSIAGNPFSGCSGLEQIIVDLENTTYDSRENCNAIIKSSDNELVAGCKNTVIPNSVTSIGNSAFSGCSGFMGSLTIPNSVTSIGSSAFYGCSGFTGDLVISNSVTSIGSSAFSNCTGLTSLTIGNSVTLIGSSAFYGCSGFTGDLTIPNSVTMIGELAFYSCNNFYTMTIFAETPPLLGSNVFSLNPNIAVFVPCGFEEGYVSQSWGGFSNFYGMCGGIVTVVADFEEGGTVSGGGTFEVGQTCTVTATADENYTFANWTMDGLIVSYDVEYTFYVAGDMTLLAHFVPDGNIAFTDSIVKNICVSHWDTNGDGELSYAEAAVVTNLDDYFRNNTQITTFVELQYFIGLSYINNYAFQSCSGLTSIILPISVTAIGEGAFYSCTGLTGNLTIPNSVTTIGGVAFYSCTGLTGTLTIPNSVITIGGNAFGGCSGLIGSLIIPNSVTSIGSAAFYGCTGFTEIQYSAINCADISSGSWPPFYQCSGILTIGEDVVRIPAYMFSNCSGFTGDLTIPNSVTSIGSYAFQNCSGFTGGLTLGNSVTTIGDNAFQNCSGFTGDLTIPNSVTSIGSYAFQNCSGFAGDLTIPNSVTAIGGYAFQNCSGFTGGLTLGNSVTTIGDNAFQNCSGFTGNLTIPNSVTSIGSYAFQNCSGFSGGLTLGNSVTTIDYYAFNGCDGLNAVYYTGDINQWCDIDFSYYANPLSCAHNLFIDNVLVTDLVISETVTEIKNYAFFGATCLTSLTIPNSVTTIGSKAFYECHGLTGDLVIPNSVTTIGDDAFYWCGGFSGSLTIGNSVTRIGGYAFYLCGDFSSVTINAETPPSLGNNAFKYWDLNTPVYVPCGFYGVYSSMSWGGFNNFIGLCAGTVTVATDPEDGGTITGGGTYEGGSLCTVTATANEDYTFVCWTQNGELVSSNVEYSFIVTGDVSLVAHFIVTDDNIIFSDTNVKSICVAHWDTNGDYELSYEEAAMVTDLGNYFRNANITSFDELQYFIGLSFIGDNAFYNCRRLASIVLPNSVTAIGKSAFMWCTGFTGNLIIPNSVTTIGDDAFYGCSGFTGNLIIPNSVTTIGSEAFYRCSGFTGSLIIPNSVTTIGDGAFDWCIGISEAILFGTTPPASGSDAFGGWIFEPGDPEDPESGFEFEFNYPIYVPYESLHAYYENTDYGYCSHRIFPMAYTTISGYGEGDGSWRFVTSPLVANTNPTTVDNMIPETAYDLYSFDQSSEAEWQNYKANTEDFVLENGQGYLYANEEEVNIIFKGAFNEDETKTVDLNIVEGSPWSGWNLVGNPFPVSAYTNRSYYMMNESGSAIEPVAVSDSIAIPACTGVMMKAEATGESVVFNKTVPSNRVNLGKLQITLSETESGRGEESVIDKAVVSFNKGDALEKYVFNARNAQLYILQGGKDYAIACIGNESEIPLNFKAVKSGEYAISINVENVEMEYLHLIDNVTDANIDLLSNPNYTFKANPGDDAARFKLVFYVGEDAEDRH